MVPSSVTTVSITADGKYATAYTKIITKNITLKLVFAGLLCARLFIVDRAASFPSVVFEEALLFWHVTTGFSFCETVFIELPVFSLKLIVVSRVQEVSDSSTEDALNACTTTVAPFAEAAVNDAGDGCVYPCRHHYVGHQDDHHDAVVY